MTYAEIVTAAEQFSINIQTAVNMRVRYLEDMIETHEANLAIMEANSTTPVEFEFIDLMTEKLGKDIRSARYQLKSLQRRGKTEEGEITADMIAQAKSYPIESLISFDRSGKALAFCHNDKQPSLTLHKGHNRATCWPCGQKRYDPIDILVLRDGMKFSDAVRSLI